MDASNKEIIIKENKDEQDDSQSTDSKESHDSKEAGSKKETKWTEFRKRKGNKKVPKLLHSLSFPSQSNKLLVSSPSVPELTATDKNEKQETERFHGDGVSFKAKLIGIKDVGQPRGDRLAQDALHELKASVKASNTHKMKILINVSLDGIKIKDEKGTVLHHHPVHKISFIAQDITDPRAFGYVFGSPKIGHKFFAIKTEKAAQQLVIAMRDLFHVVFELRKKELGNGINSVENDCRALTDDEKEIEAIIKSVENPTMDILKGSIEDNEDKDKLQNDTVTLPVVDNEESCQNNNLLDLDIDDQTDSKQKSLAFDDDFFNSSAPEKGNDPFFADPLNFISSISPSLFSNTNEPLFIDVRKNGTTENINPFIADSFNFNGDQQLISEEVLIKRTAVVTGKQIEINSEEKSQLPHSEMSLKMDKYAPLANLSVNHTRIDVLEKCANDICTEADTPADELDFTLEAEKLSPSKLPASNDCFSELDPLGKDRPFVDKKDFFHDVKNPPKKVLKDLVEESQNNRVSKSTNIASSDEMAQPNGLSAVTSQHFSVNCPSEGSLPPLPPLSSNKETSSLPFQCLTNTKSESPSFSNPFAKPAFSGPTNAFDDPFFSEEFHFPSPPSNPPPPLPSLSQQASPKSEPPIPPPRPPVIIPPPLPPKRQLFQTSPIIKLVPPLECKHNDNDGDSTMNSNHTVLPKAAGTLPIPIPSRKSVGNSSANFSLTSSRSNGSLSIPSPSSSSISMSSVNGTSYGSNSPSCPPNSFSDASYLSSNFPSLNSAKMDPEIKLSEMWTNNNFNSQSPVNSHHKSVSSFEEIKSEPLKNGLTQQLNSKLFIVNNDSNNNNYRDKPFSDFVNQEDRREYTEAWNSMSSKNNEMSIFRRDIDPFADEFFTTLSSDKPKNTLNNAIEIKNNANQASRFTNPFVSD